MVGDSGMMSKVQVVGSAETVRAITTFSAAASSNMLELMLERNTLLQRKQEIEVRENLRGESLKELERYLAIIKNMNLEGQQYSVAWETIIKNFEFENKRYDEHTSLIESLCKTQKEEHLEFTEKVMSCFFDVSELVPGVVLAIRKELDLNISAEDYLDIFTKNITEEKKSFGAFVDRIDREA